VSQNSTELNGHVEALDEVITRHKDAWPHGFETICQVVAELFVASLNPIQIPKGGMALAQILEQ